MKELCTSLSAVISLLMAAKDSVRFSDMCGRPNLILSLRVNVPVGPLQFLVRFRSN